MANQKGFTLVELLAVIAVLAILLTVAGMSVFGVLNQSQEELLKDQMKTLGDTAITYVSSKRYYLEDCPASFNPASPTISLENSCYRKVTVQTLIDEELFENKNDICKTDGVEAVIVYKKKLGSFSELESYVPEGLCEY